MAELSQKKYEEAPETETKQKTDNVAQKKVLSLILMFIMFALMYFAANSGSETFMWGSLVLTIASSGFLYSKN